MRQLYLISSVLILFFLSTCTTAESDHLIAQINAALDTGTLKTVSSHNPGDKAILEVIHAVHRAQHEAADDSRIVSETEAIFKKADSLAGQVNHPGLSAWTSTQLGYYYYRLSELEKAYPHFLSASKQLAQAAPDQIIQPADCFMKTAYFFGNIGEHSLSIDYLSKAITLVDSTSSRASAIEFALGVEHLSLGDSTQAKQHFLNSKYNSKDRDPVRYAKALGELALLAMSSGQLDEAEALLQEDIRLSETHADDRNTAFARVRLAKIYVERQQWETATLLLNQANEYVEPRPNLLGFTEDITLLRLTIAKALDDQQAQLRLHQRLQYVRELLQVTDGESAVLKVNLSLQQARAENNILIQRAKLQQSKMRGVVLIALCVFLTVITFGLRRSKKQALKLQQLRFERTVNTFLMEKIKSENKYAQAQQTIQSYKTFLQERNAAIDSLKKVVAQFDRSSSSTSKDQRQELEKLLDEHLMTEENWNRFKNTFILEHPTFFTHVTEQLSDITESQLRVVLLQKLELNNHEIANLLGVGQDSIKKAKQRLRKKYGIRYDQLFEQHIV